MSEPENKKDAWKQAAEPRLMITKEDLARLESQHKYARFADHYDPLDPLPYPRTRYLDDPWSYNPQFEYVNSPVSDALEKWLAAHLPPKPKRVRKSRAKPKPAAPPEPIDLTDPVCRHGLSTPCQECDSMTHYLWKVALSPCRSH